MENNPYTRADYFTLKAREEGYHARSVYKLIEVDKKYNFLKPGHKVLDLGATPGSWSQYALQKVGKTGSVIGIDIKNMKADLGPNYHFIHGDILEKASELKKLGPFDVVISDMAPDTTGVKSQDVYLSHELSFMALEVAKETLTENGFFICKVFQGEGMDELYFEIKSIFKKFKTVKPQAVRKNSKEIYVTAQILKNPNISLNR